MNDLDQRRPQDGWAVSESRSYASARVAVARGDSTTSLSEGAIATRRWTKEETLVRLANGPEFPHPRLTPAELDDQVRGYEQITGDLVRFPKKRNLLAACYRVHGDDFLPLVRETFEHTGTATNLLGELRVRSPRQGGPVSAAELNPTTLMEPDSPTPADGGQRGASGVSGQLRPNGPSSVDTDSAWCGCPEAELRPGLLYCAAHRPEFGSAPKHRYDRRPSNPAAARFFAPTAGQSASGAPWH
jgi:hypothetical protein